MSPGGLSALSMSLVALLVWADFRGHRPLRYLAKPLASTAFILVGLTCAARVADDGGASSYGACILTGLVLSWWGDVFLMADGRPRLFLAGLTSFLLGHIAYVAAFVQLGLHPTSALAALVLIVPAALVVLRWLRPHVPPDRVWPVRAYIAVISVMEATAISASFQAGDPVPAIGATLFFASDLAVARDRFVVESPWNGAWGLPLYYAGQNMLALSILGRMTGS